MHLIAPAAAAPLYLGLVSGTSADGVEVDLARFTDLAEVIASRSSRYPDPIRLRVLALTRSHEVMELVALGPVGIELGYCFADAGLALLREVHVNAHAVAALGEQGKIVYHQALGSSPLTTQAW